MAGSSESKSPSSPMNWFTSTWATLIMCLRHCNNSGETTLTSPRVCTGFTSSFTSRRLLRLAPDRQRARDEIMSILRRVNRASVTGSDVYNVPPDCPILRQLGTTFTIRTEASPGQVQFRPSLMIASAEGMVEAAPTVIQAKKDKFAGYSDDGALPVWLAVFVGDGISYLGLTAMHQLAASAAILEPAPFERLLIVNHVTGLRIDAEPKGASATFYGIDNVGRECSRLSSL